MLFSTVGSMKNTIAFLMLFVPSVAFSATWSVKPSDMSRHPGLSEVVNIEKTSISAKILAAYNSAPDPGETYTDSGCTFTMDIVGTCTIVASMKLADNSTSSYNIRIGVVPGSNVCLPTVELKSKTAPIIQSGDKAYVSWSVQQVTPENLCHNSCVYYASSATVSNCYRTSAGSTDGFCNFVVAVNTAAGSCTTSSGYAVGSAGAELNPDPTPDPGGGGDGGEDGGTDPDPGGGTGGGGTGGTTVVSGTVGIEFKAPGTLSSQLGHYLDEDGTVQNSATQLPKDLNNQYQESDIGKKVDGTVQSFTELANVSHQCPTGQFELFGQNIVLDAHCVLFAQIEPVLKLATYAAWLLVAVIIIFSA